MHDIAIAPDGNTALMQGGVSSDQAIKYLDTHHKTLGKYFSFSLALHIR